MRADYRSAATMQRDTHDGSPMRVSSEERATLRNAMAGAAHIALALLVAILWLTWQAIRVPLLTLLVILDPIVSFLLSALALLIALNALLWAFADSKPNFPFWTVLAGSLGCALVLAIYHALMRALSNDVPFTRVCPEDNCANLRQFYRPSHLDGMKFKDTFDRAHFSQTEA